MERSLVPEEAGEQEEEPLAKQLHQEAQGLKVQQGAAADPGLGGGDRPPDMLTW